MTTVVAEFGRFLVVFLVTFLENNFYFHETWQLTEFDFSSIQAAACIRYAASYTS